jgi:hypothetical protein
LTPRVSRPSCDAWSYVFGFLVHALPCHAMMACAQAKCLCSHAQRACLPAPRQFLGDPSNFTHVNTWSTTYYNNSVSALNKYAWHNNEACTTAYASMCEIPKTYFDCPTSPPPAPPPSPYNFGLCECLASCCCNKLPAAIMCLRSSAWAAVAWITNARSTCTLAWCICLPHMASSSNCATVQL